MKITVYELFKLIKDDKAPEMIKYNDVIYRRGWSDYMGDEPIDNYYNNNSSGWNDNGELRLDDEVEIIE